VDFRSRAMLSAFKSLHGDGVASDYASEPGLWQAQRARAIDLAEGRLYLAKVDPKDPEKTAEALRRILAEMGHKMEEKQRKATYCLKQGDGGPYFAVAGNFAVSA